MNEDKKQLEKSQWMHENIKKKHFLKEKKFEFQSKKYMALKLEIKCQNNVHRFLKILFTGKEASKTCFPGAKIIFFTTYMNTFIPRSNYKTCSLALLAPN